MNLVDLVVLAIGVSMDAFAVAVCIGLTMEKVNTKKMAIVGLYFGFFQAGMPLIGYQVAKLFAAMITSYDHWIAFGLLCFLGGKMIIGSFKKDDDCCEEISLTPVEMFPLAIATSIDALAIGVSLAFLNVKIIPAVSFIGATTFSLSMIGVKIGNVFGLKFRSNAEKAGGAILMIMGFKILLEHAGILGTA